MSCLLIAAPYMPNLCILIATLKQVFQAVWALQKVRLIRQVGSARAGASERPSGLFCTSCVLPFTTPRLLPRELNLQVSYCQDVLVCHAEHHSKPASGCSCQHLPCLDYMHVGTTFNPIGKPTSAGPCMHTWLSCLDCCRTEPCIACLETSCDACHHSGMSYTHSAYCL